jgi:hypothetical protein
LSSLFSSLQCVSSHPNSRSSDFLTTGRFMTNSARPVCGTLRLEQHSTLQQSSPQGISIIDLTESGETNGNDGGIPNLPFLTVISKCEQIQHVIEYYVRERWIGSFLCNPIWFAIYTSTFRKLCKT